MIATVRRTWTHAVDRAAQESLALALDDRGAVLVPGCTPADLLTVCDELAEAFVVHGSPVRSGTALHPTVKTVDAGQHAIALHSELAYLPVHIELLAFFCTRAPERGGETVLADALAAAESLPPLIRGRLEQQRLRYELRVPRPLWPVVQAAIEDEPLAERESFVVVDSDDEGRVRCEYLTPALVPCPPASRPALANSILAAADPGNAVAQDFYRLTMEDGAPIPASVVELLRRSTAAVSHAHPWSEGDLLLVDNRRMLHGRRAFEGSRQILARFARRRRTGGPAS